MVCGRKLLCLVIWHTVLCSANQRREAGTVCLQGVMDLLWCFLPISWIWTCISPEWRAGCHHWFSLQSWLSVVICSCVVWWPIQTWKWWMCREKTGLLQSILESAAAEVGWTSWAGTGSTSSAGPFWWFWLCLCMTMMPTLGPGRLWIWRLNLKTCTAVLFSMEMWGSVGGLLHSFVKVQVVCRLVIVPDEANNSCVVCKFQEVNRRVSWGAVIV